MLDTGAREFHPELLPRRGEINAWLLALLAASGVFLLQTRQAVPIWAWIFLGFLAFSAVSISLGNWMDRKTLIMLDGNGIRFENGIRSVWLDWPDVQKVAVLPARWGKDVQVLGEKSHFGFKTLGEVQFRGEVRGRTGFADGQKILDMILKEAGLPLVEQKENAYYYARV